MKELTFTLTVEETNQILDALGNQPFNTVYRLIGKIQQQAAGQLNDNGPVNPATGGIKQPTTISIPGAIVKEGDPEK